MKKGLLLLGTLLSLLGVRRVRSRSGARNGGARPARTARKRTSTKKWIIGGTVISLAVLFGVGFLALLYSGIYDIAARRPHAAITRSVLLTLKRESVAFHARNLDVPDLNDPQLIKRGLPLYREHCVACHGAPGESRSRIGVGLNPNPPPLEKTVEEWTTAETAWIVANGLKMAGMPAFGIGEEPRDLWAIVSFVRRLHTLSPAEYHAMVAATNGELDDEQVQWLPEDQGWTTLAEQGDANRGRTYIRQHGCVGCHRIPGITGANGMVGPPLSNWAKRQYIAGTLVNSPNNLVRWIVNPQQVEPGTAMPTLDVSEKEARDIARYLYSLGQDEAEPTRSTDANR